MTIASYTESRLLGLLGKRSSGGKSWTHLNLLELAKYFGVSERTIRRAKASLENRPDLVRFRTVSTGPGRGHKIMAALTSKLSGTSGELLSKDTAGKARSIRNKVGGQRVDSSRPPANIKRELLRNSFKQTPAIAGLAKKQASPRQKKLAHVLKRQLWDWEQWENMKVERSEAHTYGYCLKALAAGFSIQTIQKAFGEALREAHGLATDLGLANGNPTQNIFSSSSTVSKAWNRLKAWRLKSFGPRDYSGPNYMREHSYTSEVKSNPTHPGMAGNATKHPETRHRPDPRPHTQDQSPRFASILEALA